MHYQGILPGQRYCQVCGTEAVEDKIHFIFHCPRVKQVRVGILGNMKDDEQIDDHAEYLKGLLTETSMTGFTEWLEILFNARQRILYK